MKYHKFHSRWRRGEAREEDDLKCFGLYNKRARPKLFCALIIFLYFTLVMIPQHFSSTFSLIFTDFGVENGRNFLDTDLIAPLCEFVSKGNLCCDRSNNRTDICFMKGDVRTNSATSSVFLYKTNGSDSFEDNKVLQLEKIRPYTRKWEPSVMDTVTELTLIVKTKKSVFFQTCDVQHHVPALFFSTEGYTGNLFHEFNDGILPLYITSQHLNKKVVFVNLDYHLWWLMKYGDVVSELSDYPVIDFNGDNRTHCFPEAIVGLRIHGDLMIDPSKMEGKRSLKDFRNLLDRAYWPRIRGLIYDEQLESQKNNTYSILEHDSKRPRLVIIARNGSREIMNQDSLVKLAEKIGFYVEIVVPDRTSELAKIYRVLNQTDVLIGVHGAALTHFIYLNPGSVFIQIVALGTEWAAETYYAIPSPKFGVKYIDYKILPSESSLYDQYDKDDLVLTNPWKVNERGWEITKELYLDHQNVTLNLGRFRKLLHRAYYFVTNERTRHHLSS